MILKIKPLRVIKGYWRTDYEAPKELDIVYKHYLPDKEIRKVVKKAYSGEYISLPLINKLENEKEGEMLVNSAYIEDVKRKLEDIFTQDFELEIDFNYGKEQSPTLDQEVKS